MTVRKNRMAENFLEQIKEDIQTIKNVWLDNDNKLENDWYAFNYWILNYLYHIDIENISDYVTEYKDKGIDCYVHFEDTKELYIIQNCFYSEQSNLKREQIADFLVSPLSSLMNNTYTRSKTLQDIFNTMKYDKDYTLYLYYYTTKSKNTVAKDILSLFDNQSYENYSFMVKPKFIDINEIKNIYEGKRFDNVISFKCSVKIKQTDIIERPAEQHDKENNVDTAYVAINVYEIYNMLKESFLIDYDLFDKNIREYLGITGKRGKTNKEIRLTLLDETERNRFFYYNNGITIICDDFYKNKNNNKWFLNLSQPQIVNGCQTVNTIYNTIEELLENESEGDIVKLFKNCSVLVKIFKVNKRNDSEKIIYENIVKYTNTQTAISSKDFASKDNYFINLQENFSTRGFYLIVKQSDRYKFERDSELFQKMKLLSSDRLTIFDKTVTKPSDLFIDLDKMLKCLLAFYYDGYVAFKKGSCTLHETSVKYYLNFSKKIMDYFSTDAMINLFLTYEKSGGMKVARTNRYPIPYYMMDFIGRFIKSSTDTEFDVKKVNDKLSYLFSSKEIFEEVYNKICQIIEDYGDDFIEANGVDYSTMTKNREIDSTLIEKHYKQKMKEAIRNNWSYFIEYMS